VSFFSSLVGGLVDCLRQGVTDGQSLSEPLVTVDHENCDNVIAVSICATGQRVFEIDVRAACRFLAV
jgi:hypothetical protein